MYRFFSLSNKLLNWNRNIDNKFVNELVFIAFWILPAYEVCAIADVLVLNSIEFWSGDNPAADVGSVKKVDGKDGVYTVGIFSKYNKISQLIYTQCIAN